MAIVSIHIKNLKILKTLVLQRVWSIMQIFVNIKNISKLLLPENYCFSEVKVSELMDLFAVDNCELIFSTRLHGIILGSISSILCFPYEEENYINQENNLQNIISDEIEKSNEHLKENFSFPLFFKIKKNYMFFRIYKMFINCWMYSYFWIFINKYLQKFWN